VEKNNSKLPKRQKCPKNTRIKVSTLNQLVYTICVKQAIF